MANYPGFHISRSTFHVNVFCSPGEYSINMNNAGARAAQTQTVATTPPRQGQDVCGTGACNPNPGITMTITPRGQGQGQNLFPQPSQSFSSSSGTSTYSLPSPSPQRVSAFHITPGAWPFHIRRF